MLKQKYLKFKGIGRFVEEQIITFDSLSKLVQLDGQNNNTKGSSGAGKSTVFMAEDYLFGVSNRPSTVLKCRFSDEPIWVEGHFDYDGKDLVITRGKKLIITIDGVPTTGNSEKTEEKLDEIIGMPRDLFRKMLHKRQKEGGFFLDMAPADTNIFLMNASGLGHYKGKIQIADDKIDELTEKREETVSSLTAASSALKATQDAILAMGLAPIRDIQQSTVLELKEKSEKSTSALTLFLNLTKLEEATLNESKPRSVPAPFDRSAIEGLEKKYSDAYNLIQTAQAQEKDRQNQAKLKLNEYKNQLVKLENSIRDGNSALQAAATAAEQIKNIRLGKCYTCGHDWVDSQEETKIIKSIKVLREMIAAGKAAEPQVTPLAVLINTLLDEVVPRGVNTKDAVRDLEWSGSRLLEERQKEKDHQAEEHKKYKALADAFEKEHRQMRERHSAQVDQLRGQADVDRRAFEAAIGKLRAYEEARTRYEKSSTSLRAQETAYADNVFELTNRSIQVDNELAMAEELKRGLKSYLSCSFDEALDTIGKNATTLIRNIPNMANVTIELTGVTETQKGKVKDEVKAVIHMDGEEDVPIRSLSGGERTSLDIAIDLAVIDWLESKMNAGINLFIMDEPFEGHDFQNIEMVLEMLKNCNTNKRLIIVDHNDMVKEFCDSRIAVIRDGTTSKIVQ